MNVLVTGANGFIGFQVCKVLLDRGYQVVALYHHRTERLAAIQCHPHLSLEAGDILDRAGLQEICEDHSIEGVCHLAIQPPGEEAGRPDRQVNTQGTSTLLQACQQTGMTRLVHASSMSVYNFLAPAYLPVDENHPTDPLQTYGEEKKLAETCCEDYARKSGMCIPILRFSGVYGPGKRAGAVYHFIRAVLRGEDVEIQLNRRIDLVYVQDAAEAMVAALEGALQIGLEIINIGAGHSVALVELAELIGRKAGIALRLDSKAEGNEFYLDITRARQRLGYHPRSLEEGVSRFMRWIQEEEG